jgi:hypothetical protein
MEVWIILFLDFGQNLFQEVMVDLIPFILVYLLRALDNLVGGGKKGHANAMLVFDLDILLDEEKQDLAYLVLDLFRDIGFGVLLGKQFKSQLLEVTLALGGRDVVLEVTGPDLFELG